MPPTDDRATTPHEHTFTKWTTFSHAPTGPPPEHTSFIVLLCLECFAYALFPPQNFDLCTDEFKARFLARAAAEGWHAANECACRTSGCGHPASAHIGGSCVVCGRAGCWR